VQPDGHLLERQIFSHDTLAQPSLPELGSLDPAVMRLGLFPAAGLVGNDVEAFGLAELGCQILCGNWRTGNDRA
jgi:hypothetical protein